MTGMHMALPLAASIIAGLAGLFIGRRITDPSDKMDEISKEIDFQVDIIRDSLASNLISEPSPCNVISRATKKIGELTAELRELRVCKRIFSDTNMFMTAILGLLVSAFLIIMVMAIPSDRVKSYENLVQVFSILLILSVSSLGAFSIFYFLLYRLHQR